MYEVRPVPKPDKKTKPTKIMNQKSRVHDIEKGELCVRCDSMDGTIRPAHYEGEKKYLYGKGISQKCDDRMVADLCQKCTDIMDKKPSKDDHVARLEHDNEWLHLILKTLLNKK